MVKKVRWFMEAEVTMDQSVGKGGSSGHHCGTNFPMRMFSEALTIDFTSRICISKVLVQANQDK